MFSSADKVVKSTPAVQQKAAGNTFFKKAGEGSIFGANEQTSFFAQPVQAKLTVSTPDDPHEMEADAVAEHVMRMPEPFISLSTEKTEDKLHLKEEEELHAKQDASIANGIHCKEGAEEKLHPELQRSAGPDDDNHLALKEEPVSKADHEVTIYNKNISLYQSDILRQSGRGPPAAAVPFEQTLASTKGGGSALPADTKGFMESRFNADFSGVRIHTDSTAQNLSNQVNAQAFAHGNDIYFNKGKFSPDSKQGGALLAHELTHTIQQGASKSNTSAIHSKKSLFRKNALQHRIDRYARPSLKRKTDFSTTPVIQAGDAATGLHTSSKEENEHLQKATIAEPVSTNKITNAESSDVKNALTIYSDFSINAENKDFYKKEDKLEEKDTPYAGIEHLVSKQASVKSADLQLCGCTACSMANAKKIETKIFASTEHSGTNTTSVNLLSDATPGRGPPGDQAIENTTSKIISRSAGIAHDNNTDTFSNPTAASPVISRQHKAEIIQKDDDPAGAAAPKEESFFDKLKSGFDGALKVLLPDSVYKFYTKLKNGGILNYIKDTIAGLFKGLFGKLGFSEKEIQIIFQVFATLKAQLPAIISGLENGDCKPLFAALNLLSEVLSAIAGRLWDNLMAELEPVRLWLIDIWQTFGAPVIDEITAFAGEQWENLKTLGRFIWDSFKPVRDKGADAWDWVVDKLGFGSSDEPGLIGYISGKLSEAWDSLKAELKPVIAPINDVIEGIKTLAGLASIKQLQEDAKKWLDEVVKTATAMGGDEDAVANKQLTLRQVLLPALNKSIDKLKSTLKAAGDWITEKVGFVANSVTSFITGLQGNTYLSPMYSLISWVPRTVDSLKDWATDKVNDIFEKLQTGAEHLKAFIEPVLKMLEKLVSVASNILSHLPDFILGVPFMLMPKCIKDPIIKWLTEVILKQIPIISEFISLTEKWDQIKTAALTVLKQVFVDGQLAKGLWTFFKTLLGILGIDPKLVTKVVAKAAQNFKDIISKPGAFFQNIWTAIKGGFSLFFDHIAIHLPKGALDWLFGEVKGATAVAPPKDFSIGSIFGFVLELFGITKANVYARMTDNPRIGPQKVEKIKKIENALTGALEWITVWIKEGAEGLLKKIKKDVGDLKDMVIQGVVSWVTSSIIAEITKRLLTSADPLGIGATLNTIKLVYDTLKTAVAYINRMLDMVNSIMDSVADIISGNTKAASVYLEGVLAKAVPFVVGFAVEVIIGPVGEKIKDIVGGVRKKIDAGIDFLINGALNFIDTIINTGKTVAGAVAGWLGMKKEFTSTAGNQHKIYFKGSGSAVYLILESDPIPVKAFLSKRKSDISKDTTIDPAKKSGDLQKINQAEGLIVKLNSLTYPKDKNAKPADDNELEILSTSDAMVALLKDLDPGDAKPIPTPTFIPGFNGNRGQFFEVKYLSNFPNANYQKGESANNYSGNLSGALDMLQQMGIRAKWVAFHIVNDNYGGKATDSNLVPAPQYINKNYRNEFEDRLKEKLDNKGVSDYKRPVWMKFSSSYRGNTNFLNSMSASGGAMKFEGNEWVADSSLNVPAFSATVDEPRAESIEINALVKDDILWYFYTKETGLDTSALDFLAGEVKSGVRFSSKADIKSHMLATFIPSATKGNKTKLTNQIDKTNFSFT